MPLDWTMVAESRRIGLELLMIKEVLEQRGVDRVLCMSCVNEKGDNCVFSWEMAKWRNGAISICFEGDILSQSSFFSSYHKYATHADD